MSSATGGTTRPTFRSLLAGTQNGSCPTSVSSPAWLLFPQAASAQGCSKLSTPPRAICFACNRRQAKNNRLWQFTHEVAARRQSSLRPPQNVSHLYHVPPRAVLIPRAESARAMPRSDWTPLACICWMTGRTLFRKLISGLPRRLYGFLARLLPALGCQAACRAPWRPVGHPWCVGRSFHARAG